MWGLSFLSPFVLSGLFTLPVIWWLLRVTPPPHRTQHLPTMAFLHNLPRTVTTAIQTPWWILLIRLLALGFLMIGIAGPVVKHNAVPSNTPKNYIFVFENGWSAAHTWFNQKADAEKLLRSMANDNTQIHILTTAPEPGQDVPLSQGPYTPVQAIGLLPTINLHPWEETLPRIKLPEGPAQTFWFGDGFDHDGQNKMMRESLKKGHVTYFAPDRLTGPLRLQRETETAPEKMVVQLDVPEPFEHDRSFQLETRNQKGAILSAEALTLPAGTKTLRHHLNRDLWGPNEPASFSIVGANSASAVVFLDGLIQIHTAAIIGTLLTDESPPLLRPEYYLTRAIEPYARFNITPFDRALKDRPDIIFAPDFSDPDPSVRDALVTYIQQGGILVRFAGPKTADRAHPALLPVPIYQGSHATAGLSSWTKPPQIKAFSATSPLAGLSPPDQINLRQQLLAEPLPGNDPAIWASVTDGTPLITGRKMGRGLIVLVHTSADPSWSDLPLTGFFAAFLKRLLQFADDRFENGPMTLTAQAEPIVLLDGFGQTQPPPATAQPIDLTIQAGSLPDSRHPPGLYQSGTQGQAINLSEHTSLPRPGASIPDSVERRIYSTTPRSFYDLRPYVLGAALFLILIDGMILLALQGLRFTPVISVLVLICALAGNTAQAADLSDLTTQTHLAYIVTPDAAQNRISMKGLSTLTETLRARTAIRMGDPKGLDLPRDDISLYPWIYWPVFQDTAMPDTKTLEKINDYLQRGGLIVFDTQDGSATIQPVLSQSWLRLQVILRALGTDDIRPVDERAVLLRSFYLLDRYIPGPDFGTLWIQSNTENNNDSVSSIIVSSGDWARNWSQGTGFGWENGRPDRSEIATRIGINITLYALTGNYKADQVHIQYIIDRMNTRGGGP